MCCLKLFLHPCSYIQYIDSNGNIMYFVMTCYCLYIYKVEDKAKPVPQKKGV